VKCVESLAFLVRDVAHITPYNFDECVHCIRTFVEATLNKGTSNQSRQNSPGYTSNPNYPGNNSTGVPEDYTQVTIQLLDLMHTLHTRTGQIFKWWAEEGATDVSSLWTQGWCPLLQGIARLCCDHRKHIRTHAVAYLQRALLVHDLQTLTGIEWEECFERVLFPLLDQLLNPNLGQGFGSIGAVEEIRMRAATLLSKVFLHHLSVLSGLGSFIRLWQSVLGFMHKYMTAGDSDLLAEAVPETLKNILLVMDSAGCFASKDSTDELWRITWEKIDSFLPDMKDELFKEKLKVKANEELPNEAQENPIKETGDTRIYSRDISDATRTAGSMGVLPQGAENVQSSTLFAHLGQMVSTPIGPPVMPVPNANPLSSPNIVPLIQNLNSINTSNNLNQSYSPPLQSNSNNSTPVSSPVRSINTSLPENLPQRLPSPTTNQPLTSSILIQSQTEKHSSVLLMSNNQSPPSVGSGVGVPPNFPAHTFPVLCNPIPSDSAGMPAYSGNSSIPGGTSLGTMTIGSGPGVTNEPLPLSLYSEFLTNPYNIPDATMQNFRGNPPLLPNFQSPNGSPMHHHHHHQRHSQHANEMTVGEEKVESNNREGDVTSLGLAQYFSSGDDQGVFSLHSGVVGGDNKG